MIVNLRYLLPILGVFGMINLSAYTHPGNSGPWGELIISDIYLEAPNSVIDVVGKPDPVPRWTFSRTSVTTVKDILIQAGVEMSLVARLTTAPQLVMNGTDVIIFPKTEDLLEIKGQVRDKLYSEIAKFPLNEYYADPVFILSGDVEEWLSETSLNAEQKNLFRQLTWHRGEALVFSNVGLLLQCAKTNLEIDNTLRAITRCMSLVVSEKFPLKPEQREPFLKYWFANQPESPRMTFIKAISKENDINDSVDILHFLPVLIREKAYTFPSLKDGMKGRLPDCHWTSLNFFNLTAKDYYRNTSLAAIQLTQSYDPVQAPYQFGDVLCYIDKGEGLHTCVYIADEIVLTKNGENILAPWVLLYIKDVSKIYKRSPTTLIQGYRLKPVK